ncbi:transmembrane channel-like protein 7 isoform X2 [Gigantopelta aegis]|uniref:transmembrane channel-like protein 7 isoform X2 n=2 Tax=Gigantopelta aegis TaxID=1735272 RepID=UPI001B88CE09|nr:transmembrane channel-like protein 7 isoform X2 [Gigantopelta aegis]
MKKKKTPPRMRPALDLRKEKGTYSGQPPDEGDDDSVFVDQKESQPLLSKTPDVFQDDDPDWKRTTRAAIFDRLPSHCALASDEGITMARTLGKTWRRRARNHLRQAETEVDGPSCSYAEPLESGDSRHHYDLSLSSDHDSSFHTLSKRSSVKSMTARMAVRRKYITFEEQVGVTTVKRQFAQTWNKNKKVLKGWLYQLELWAGTLKEIEGQFGMAIVSYFRFTRWLLLLNFVIFTIMFCVIVVPFLALRTPSSFQDWKTVPSLNESDMFHVASNCTSHYAEYMTNLTSTESIAEKVLDFMKGTGWMERTELFYGVYFNKSYTVPGKSEDGTYNMSLAYMLATWICFLISFMLIVKNSGKSVKEAVTDQENTTTMYCNKVFGGWDFCISNPKTATQKQASLAQELKADLNEYRRRILNAEKTRCQRYRLYMIRLIINLFVLAILGATLYLVYWTTQTLLDLRKQNLSEIVDLIVEYLPSLTVTFLNFVIPLMFSKVVIAEQYSPSFELKLTLFRTVLLRLASLGVLAISLYIQLLSSKEMKCDVKTQTCCGNTQWVERSSTQTKGTIKCWETYVGQQFYKLALVDFVAVLMLTFFEFIRKLLYDKFQEKSKLVKMFGQQEFELPTNVLDIVYSQTICWLGMFFSPLIPAITLIKVFIIFYLKKFSVLKNCTPPVRPYRASRSNSFFMTILLLSFILSVIPVGYIFGNIQPSQSCGPFRVYSQSDFVFFDIVSNTVSTWPAVARDIFFFLGTVGFFIPAIILLLLCIYYFWAAGQGYKKMEEILKEQLRLEGKDRQFLLMRVNDVIQKGELQTAKR